MTPPPILLKPLTTEMLADLQEMYQASPRYFGAFTGHPAHELQAANDYHALLDSNDRAIMAIWWQDKQLIGSLDFRFHHPQEQTLWLGALILRDDTPAEREMLASWAVKILEEWLRIATDITEIRTAIPLKEANLVRFWRDHGYELTPELLRQPVAGKQIRFGLFRKTIKNL